jgi:hypothetical protein
MTIAPDPELARAARVRPHSQNTAINLLKRHFSEKTKADRVSLLSALQARAA